MAYIFNPFTVNLDRTTNATELADDFVNVTGDTMFGQLRMQQNAFRMTSPNGTEYVVTIDNDGRVHTESLNAGTTGTPLGLLLSITTT